METLEQAVAQAGPDYAGRLTRLREKMGEHGVQYTFVGPSADLLYLTGLDMHSSERLALLVVGRDGPARMVIPFFELEGWGSLPAGIEFMAWQETENPAQMTAGLVSGAGVTVAVSDQLHGVFLLRLQRALPGAQWVEANEVLAALRMVKDDYEMEALREAGRVGDRSFKRIRKLKFAGRSERQVAADIAAILLEEGVSGISWGPIVGSGPNGANPHHTAGERTIQNGDLVVLDFGGLVNHYELDITRTVAVGGEPQGEMREVYELVRRGQEAAVQAEKPGISGEQLDSVTRDIFTEAGYGQYFTHRLGHGLGLDGHEPPYIVQGNKVPLAVGNCHSIEPGIYISGRFGVRIEDIVILHADGAERMNNAPREIVVVE